MTHAHHIVLKPIAPPKCWHDVPSVTLHDATFQQRKASTLARMAQQNLDALVIYADKEHGANFEYLTGFIPRFEEALLVLHRSGEAVLVLGNENLKLARFCRLEARAVHAPWFSLPNQPMTCDFTLTELLQQAGLGRQKKTGVVGWKLFTGEHEDVSQFFDLPSFIMQAITGAVLPDSRLTNATGLFVSPVSGLRIINNANALAHYEYGANLASTAVLTALDAIAPGKTEKQIGALLAAEGQPNNVMMIAATGDRFENARLHPGDKIIQRGDKFSLTVGYKGGLSSRAAYVVASARELPSDVSDYLDVVAIPYYRAVVGWLEHLRIGTTGGEMYRLIERMLPKADYHWHLNPGHLVADEEWLCSPIMPESDAVLKSGMIFQIDIIPSRAGYAGASIEDTVALADEALRTQLEQEHPAMWARICARREYIGNTLGIRLPPEVLPFSNTVGYLRPWLLDSSLALVCE